MMLKKPSSEEKAQLFSQENWASIVKAKKISIAKNIHIWMLLTLSAWPDTHLYLGVVQFQHETQTHAMNSDEAA